MPYFSTQEALACFRLSIPLHSTKLHRHSTATLLRSTLLIPAIGMQLTVPPRSKPHRAVGRIGSLHCRMQVNRIVQHNLLLHLRFEPSEVSKEDVLRGHNMAYLEHESSELLVVALH